MILGTAATCRPNRRGASASTSADIWAFGVVLFEMLTGKRLFAGETVSDTLAAVLTKDPDWNALPPAAPASLRRLLRRCLERDPKRRSATSPTRASRWKKARANPRRPKDLGEGPNRVGVLAGLLLVAAVAFVAGKWIDHAPRSAKRARDLAFMFARPGMGPPG